MKVCCYSFDIKWLFHIHVIVCVHVCEFQGQDSFKGARM